MIADEIDARKLQALNAFTERLLASSVGGKIARILLHGSVARGEAGRDSDVDVVVLAAGPVREVERTADEVAANVWLEYGDRVEPMTYPAGSPIAVESPFVYRVLQEGQEVYRMADEALRREEIRTLYELATIYLNASRARYNPTDEGSRRLTVDGAYNTIELAAKAFLRTRDEQLPKSHNGVSNRFSDLFVRTGIVPRQFGGQLSTALRLRNRARYDRHSDIVPEQVDETLRFAEEIVKALEKHLSS